MRARQFFQRMHHFESRTGAVLFLVRLGLAVYLGWTGYELLGTQIIFGTSFIGLGVIMLLGILRRLMALLVIGVLVAQFFLLGSVNPAMAMAVLIAVALLLGPSH